jgi:hypothetical protein
MELFLTPLETTYSYWTAMRRYLPYGKPRALYSDKSSIFRVNWANTVWAIRERAGVEVICANTPQANGKVENVNGTLQDRLVKKMRLAWDLRYRRGYSMVADVHGRFQYSLRSRTPQLA